MKHLRLLILVTVLSIAVIGCEMGTKEPRDIPFACTLGGKLHIFSDSGHPAQAGLPSDAKSYIINGEPIADEFVNLGQGVQSLEKLTFTIVYEYHANSTNTPAALEFVVKDSGGNQIWRGKQNFLPSVAKKQTPETFELPIGREYDGMDVSVEVKPVSAGDFGFYIYSLDGVLTVK